MAVDDVSGNQKWTSDQVAVLSGAVWQAPSVHNIRPWTLRVSERAATLYERADPKLVRHDPHGRDRRISCGAALTNLVLAVLDIGWDPKVWREPHSDQSDVVAVVTSNRQRQSTPSEARRFRAIARRSSYRHSFLDQSLPENVLQALTVAASSSRVHVTWITAEESEVLARLLLHAASVHRGDPYYQRELMTWTVEADSPDLRPEGGIPAEALGDRGLSAVGLATSATHLPDEQTLAERIASESVCVLTTDTDEPSDHLRAGEAMEWAWLEASVHDVAASVMTQPLQLSEVRSRLVARLELPGVPQLLMRFGYPWTAAR